MAMLDSDVRRPDAPDLPTGKGVVVGHIDWGVDLAHPDFRLPDGRTRLLALWDQRGPAFADRPNRYGYGRIFLRDEIDQALRSGDPYGALAYHPADFDPGSGTHGTNTLSISAGNGRSGGPLGVAPQADLAFVHLSTYTADGPVNLGDSVALIEAIDFLLRTAASPQPASTGDGRAGAPTEHAAGAETAPPSVTTAPVVINASLGRHGGPHVGSTLVEQGLDAALREAPGRAIVLSTGNYFAKRAHACGTLRPGEVDTLVVRLGAGGGADVAVPTEVEIWYPGADRLAIAVTAPDGTRLDPTRGDERRTLLLPAADGAPPREIGRIYHRLRDPNNGDNEAVLFLDRGAPAGEYRIDLIGEDVSDGRYHAWIERSSTRRWAQAEFDGRDARPSFTTGTICNGFRTIAVGAYDVHAWAARGDTPGTVRPLGTFSSSGPTRDGRQKPDLCAPGVQILAARSHPRRWPGDGDGAPPPLLTRMSGTSMAAPHVTGTVALMFEAAPRPLAIEETRRLLLASTDQLPDDAPAEARHRVGNGFLRTDAAVAAVRAHASSAVTSVVAVEQTPHRTARTAPSPSARHPTASKETVDMGSDTTRPSDQVEAEWREPPAEGDRAAPSEAAPMLDAESEESYPGYDADAFEGVEETWVEGWDEAAKKSDDHQGSWGGGRASRWRQQTPPISFVVPLGGGGIAPALTVPVGGSGSPFAFALPLMGMGTQPATSTGQVVGVPVIPVTGVAAAGGEPGGYTPVVVAEPSTTPIPDVDEWEAGGGPKPSPWAGEQDETEVSRWEAADERSSGEHDEMLGERLVAVADSIAGAGGAATSSGALHALLEAVGEEAGLNPMGRSMQSTPTATELFRAFVHGGTSGPERSTRRACERRFAPVGLPGRRLDPGDLRAGDLVVRVARGEGWGTLGVVAEPTVGQGAMPGGYLVVVDGGPTPRTRGPRVARRVTGAGGAVLPDTLILRVRLQVEAEERVDERDAAEQAGAAVDWCQMRRAIARIARAEEARWTRPNGTKLREDDPAMLATLASYWATVPGFTAPAAAMQAARRSAADDPDFPWSAAFICFAMHTAGVRRAHGFEFGQRHLAFIVGSLRNRERSDQTRVFWLSDHVEIEREATPQPGDLICFNRCCHRQGAPASAACPAGNAVMSQHTYASLRTQFWTPPNQDRPPRGCSHTAIVVGTVTRGGETFVETIGGNEGNSVRSSSALRLNESGGIVDPPAHHVFGLIKITAC